MAHTLRPVSNSVRTPVPDASVSHASSGGLTLPSFVCGDSPGRNDAPLEHVHLVGVAGTGLRGMAGILTQRGLQVTGSEASGSATVDDLRLRGVRCHVGHRFDNLAPETELVVVSAAIRKDNPEVVAARQLGIPVLKYAEFLGVLMGEKQGIAVSGTHGKTTTTALLAHVLLENDEDPSFLVGGDCPDLGGSARWGDGPFLVAEACEFDRSFLNLRPRFAIVTNIEEEHLDYFQSIGEIQSAFAEFTRYLPEDGYLVLNAEDSQSRILSEHTSSAVGRFSLRRRGGDWWASNIRRVERGTADGFLRAGIAYTAESKDGESIDVNLPVPGIHNVKNSLAVIVLLRHLGMPLENIVSAVESFAGVKRRFDVLLESPVTVVDDYAHHPTEIETVVEAARDLYPDRRLRLVFQPHQYSRTHVFLDGFASVLAAADEVLITEVFAARDSEEDRARINSRVVVDRVNECGGNARYAPTFDFVESYLKQTCDAGDVVICMGAGSITLLARQIAGALTTETAT